MPETYNIQEFAAKIRARRPDLGHIPDATLVGKTIEAAPELKQYLSNDPGSYESPTYGPTGATAKEVMQDQAASVLRGIPKLITGIPGAAAELGGSIYEALSGQGSARGQKMIQGAVEGIAQPFAAAARGAAALVAPNAVEAPSREEFEQAAEGAGANLAGTVAAPLVGPAGRAVKGGTKAAVRTAMPNLQARATANQARVLAPSTLQGRADAAAIAEEVSQRGGIPGIRAKTIDRNIVRSHDEAGQRVRAAEDRLTQEARPEFQTSKRELLDEIDSAKAKLKIPRTNVTARPEAIAQLDETRALVDRMPDFIDFDQLIELKRQLDARADDAGSYGVNADTLKADINRGVADIARGKLNQMDDALRSANHDYSVARKQFDIVQRRELGETGKIGSGLPGRGPILDDILATWAGQAMGGPVGAAVAEGINLASQSRGFASARGKLQQRLANFSKKPLPQPKGLLNARPPILSAPESSSVKGVPGEVAKREVKGLFPLPKNVIITPTPPDPSRLQVVSAKAGVARDPKTGKMFRYYTSEEKK